MQILFSQLLLLIYCFLGIAGQSVSSDIIVAFLFTIVIVTMTFSFHLERNVLLFYAYAIAAFFYPALYTFLPMLFFEIGEKKYFPCMVLFGAGALYHYEQPQINAFLFQCFGCILALFLQYLIRRYDKLDAKYRKTTDDSTELNLLLKQKNQSLLEKQDYEVHNATLQERNRIAREIHDNVGHLLSRCILLNGAIQTINHDENCTESLRMMQDTLSQAMDNIRNSVHNLHDNSINLQGTIEALIRDFTFCTVRLECDISKDVPVPVRYAFISITKEALTNIAKHSNATMADIILREHPAMYQLIIRDNGKKSTPMTFSFSESSHENMGIGLVNIRDRVAMLGGILQINAANGFQIFISIPKDLHESGEVHSK